MKIAALEGFLEINRTARIYAQEKAFEPHYSKRDTGKASISLNGDLYYLSCGEEIYRVKGF